MPHLLLYSALLYLSSVCTFIYLMTSRRRCLFHTWGKWEDLSTPSYPLYQVRACSICNKRQLRSTI